MKAFLNKTAEYIYKNFGNDLSELCIVLPNRRAGLFLKKYLATYINKTIWSPEIYSIEDFIVKISGYQIIDPISLLFEFYEIHKKIEGKKAQDFEEFLNWSQVLLHDFNDIDQYLVRSADIFSYLTDTKAISLWNLDAKPLTDFEKSYLQFYNSLSQYHKLLTNHLINKKLVYQGLAYRKTTENIKEILQSISWNKIIFAGFNALTTAEERIIFSFTDAGIAEVLWDADEYYMKKDKNKTTQPEAGRFLNKYFNNRRFKEFKWVSTDFLNTEKNINVIGIPQNIGQAKVCGQILTDFSKNNTFLHETAVVLADENLLIPVLNSIPENITDFNVTMGLPLKLSPLFNLFDNIFTLHENAERIRKTKDSAQQRFHIRDIIKILQHNYISGLFENLHEDEFPQLNKIIKGLITSNKIFFTSEEIKSAFISSSFLKLKIIEELISNWKQQPVLALENFSNIIRHLREIFISLKNNSDYDYKIELEYLFSFSKIIKRINSIINDYDSIKTIKTLRNIFNRIVASTKIPFYGEPLKGLQIMGMLETRTLDFNNLILLSVNEDIIPGGKNTNTFIPFDIKRKFGLPTYNDKNAIFAYHFYRLLQRSKNIHLLYNTEPDNLGGGEKSRFINQIINELPKYNSKIKISEKLFSLPPVKDKINHSIKIPKTPEIIKLLKDKAINGFSPSSINSFINCQLQFYFKEIAGLSEADEIEETIDAAKLGTIIHEVMKEFYKPHVNKILKIEDVKNMLPEVNSLTDRIFIKHQSSGDINYGKNLLILNVAYNYITNFLKKEIQEINRIEKQGNFLTIKFIEEKFITTIKLNDPLNSDKEIIIKLKGTIDRIDKIEDSLRIIDYKSGRTDPKELKITEWEQLINESTLSKSFQLLFYSWLFQKNDPIDFSNIVPGIISFRNLSKWLMKISIPSSNITQKEKDNINTEGLNEFENILKKIICEIFNTSHPFEQTNNIDNCKYCPFKSICNL